jgi:hypothetical protein
MGQVYQCWWRICREINVFFPPVSNITCFVKFYIHLWTYLPTLPRNNVVKWITRKGKATTSGCWFLLYCIPWVYLQYLKLSSWKWNPIVPVAKNPPPPSLKVSAADMETKLNKISSGGNLTLRSLICNHWN